MCERCATLESELGRLRLQAQMDIENANTDLMIQRRVVAKLKGELTRLRDTATPPGEVDGLLALWVQCRIDSPHVPTSGRPPDVAKGGKRWLLAQKAIKRWTLERCQAVVRAGCANPFVNFGERVPDPSDAASGPWVDVEHLLGDEVRFERCERAAARPNLTPDEQRTHAVVEQHWSRVAGMSEPDRIRHFARSLPPERRPSSEMRDVLDALTAAGLAWRKVGRESFMAQCCCHEDRTPSLSLRVGDVQPWVAHCHGCGAETLEVRAALRLDEAWAA